MPKLYTMFQPNDKKQIDSIKECISSGQYDKALQKLNKFPDKFEPALLLKGLLFIMMNHPEKTVALWKVNMKKKNNSVIMMKYYGLACFLCQKHKDAVKAFKELPSMEYNEKEFILPYAISLMNIHKYKSAFKLMLPLYQHYVENKQEVPQKTAMSYTLMILELYILLNDEDSFADKFQYFLSVLPVFMQEKDTKEGLAEIILMISGHLATMNYEWLPPYFYELITITDHEAYLKNTEFEITVTSGYTCWESYYFVNDERIPNLIEDLCILAKDEEYEQLDKPSYHIILWNSAELYQENPECFAYMQSAYPHSWNKIKKIVNDIKKNPEAFQEKSFKELLLYTNASPQKFRESMRDAYEKSLKN